MDILLVQKEQKKTGEDNKEPRKPTARIDKNGPKRGRIICQEVQNLNVGRSGPTYPKQRSTKDHGRDRGKGRQEMGNMSGGIQREHGV